MEKKLPSYLKKNQKNNSRAFVVLCNNVQFFHHFCKWFPKEEFVDYDFYVVFDNRLNNIEKELELVRDSTDNINIRKFNVINGDEILDFYKDEFKFAYKNKFCLNNLKDVYFLENYDYVYGQDDDIVVFRYGKIWQTKQNVLCESGNLDELRQYISFCEMVDETPLIDPKKVHVTHVGQYFLNKSIYETYVKACKLIYCNEELTDKIVNETRGSTLNAWYLDNIIMRAALTFYRQIPYKHYEFASILGNNYLVKRDNKITKKVILFHYAGSKKPKIYELLEKNVLEKLLKKNDVSISEENLTTISRAYYEGLQI